MRAKMRISYGYEIQRPNSWMDGQQREDRLRLEKLYSNEYLDSLEDLMHRDFLYPLVTTLRKNVVLAASGTFTKSGKPILFNVIEARNYPTKIFFPVELILDGETFFSFTIPGLPLLLSGSSNNIAWAFSGTLIDRTNVEQIETTGMRFFD
jgi:acyl-homoserine lactone acylase PvdQ